MKIKIEDRFTDIELFRMFSVDMTKRCDIEFKGTVRGNNVNLWKFKKNHNPDRCDENTDSIDRQARLERTAAIYENGGTICSDEEAADKLAAILTSAASARGFDISELMED